MRSLASRRGIAELVGSLSMLAITMALLGGASFLALLSIHNAAGLVDGAAREQERDAGVLLDIVGSQSNSSGTYVWIYDYGWESAPVQSVFLSAEQVRWSTTCSGDWSGSLCVVVLPQASSGLLTIVVGGKSVEASI